MESFYYMWRTTGDEVWRERGWAVFRAIEKEAKTESLTVVGVSASLGMHGRGKSRRFIKGDVPFDQIGTAWGGHMW